MLEALLQQEIQTFGPIPQSRFMELCLQHPQFGYYRTQQAVAKDFITSPEISQIFGELIGVWVLDLFTQLGSPDEVTFVELGPGRGTLMADLFRVAEKYPPFLKAVNLNLVEINPHLKAQQQTRLPPSTTWHENFHDIPLSDKPLILLANEFFDAFPTDFYVREDNKLYQRCIGLDGPALAPIGVSPGPDESWEESPSTERLFRDICQRISQQRGAFLCIDYGYERGRGESLQALYQGKPSDPFTHVGETDLSCHVNFGRLAEIAKAQHLTVSGPLSQGQFLFNLGLEARLSCLKEHNPGQASTLEAATLRLTHPSQMGTLFKAMAISSPKTLSPLGFTSCL